MIKKKYWDNYNRVYFDESAYGNKRPSELIFSSNKSVNSKSCQHGRDDIKTDSDDATKGQKG